MALERSMTYFGRDRLAVDCLRRVPIHLKPLLP